MKTRYFISIVLIALIIIIACSKKEDENINDIPIKTELLLKQLNFDEGYITYDYYSNNKLKTEYWYYSEDGSIGAQIRYEYTDNIIWSFTTGFMTDGSIEKDSVKYERINDELSRRDIYGNDSDVYINYYFSDESCGFTSLEIYTNGSLQSQTIAYYMDENCSSTEITTYEIYNLSDNKLITLRDDKNSAQKSTTLDFYRKHDLGNPIKETYYDYRDTIVAIYKSVYEYNSDNYPISVVRTRNDSEPQFYTFEYY